MNSDLKKGYFDSPLGQVHFLKSGEGNPLLMLHMTPQSSLQFSQTFSYLNELGIQTIAPDTLGYGMSEKPSAPLSIEEYASVLPYLLDELGIEKTSIVGHHTGAAMACALAKAYPDRIDKMILHGVPLYTDEERTARMDNLKVDLSPKKDGSHLTDYWNWIQSRVQDRATLEACHMSLLHVFLAGENEWFCHHAAFQYDLKQTLSDLKQSCLLISNTGDPLHYIVPRVQKLREDFQYNEIEGGSVFIIRDDPKQWVESFIDFLKQ